MPARTLVRNEESPPTERTTPEVVADLLEYIAEQRVHDWERAEWHQSKTERQDDGGEWYSDYYHAKAAAAATRRANKWERIHEGLTNCAIDHANGGADLPSFPRILCCGESHATPHCPLCGKKIADDWRVELSRCIASKMRLKLSSFHQHEERTDGELRKLQRCNRKVTIDEREGIDDRRRYAKRIYRKYLLWESRQDALAAVTGQGGGASC